MYTQLYTVATAGVTPYLAFYASSSLDRVLPNFAADHNGILNMQVMFVSVTAILSLCLGFFTGTFVSLPGPTVATLSPNLAFLVARISIVFMSIKQ